MVKLRIIFEGADGTGKTTLARAISDAFLLDYEHRGVPASSAELLKDITRDGVVFDRSFIGEFVYPYVFNRSPVISRVALSSRLIGTGVDTLVVIMSAPSPYLLKDNESTVVKNTWFDVNDKFLGVSNYLPVEWQKVIFNPAHFTSQESMIGVAKKFIYAWSRRQNPYPRHITGYEYTVFDPQNMTVGGSLEAKRACRCPIFKQHVESEFYARSHSLTMPAGNLQRNRAVFVGEAPGYLGCGRLGIPFYGDASGSYFRNAIFWHGWTEADVIMTNAVWCAPSLNKLDVSAGEQCFRENALPFLAGRTGVIAVGSVAGRYLQDAAVVNLRIKHPAYYLYKGLSAMDYANYFTENVWRY